MFACLREEEEDVYNYRHVSRYVCFPVIEEELQDIRYLLLILISHIFTLSLITNIVNMKLS